jgi:hypothetical protein
MCPAPDKKECAFSDSQSADFYQLDSKIDTVQSLVKSDVRELQHKIDNLELHINTCLPGDLINRFSIIEHTINRDNDVNELISKISILENALVDSKGTMKERIAFFGIITALIGTIAFLIVKLVEV